MLKLVFQLTCTGSYQGHILKIYISLYGNKMITLIRYYDPV